MSYLYLLNVWISVIGVFENSFPNFDTAGRENNFHYSAFMDMVGKAEILMERALI